MYLPSGQKVHPGNNLSLGGTICTLLDVATCRIQRLVPSLPFTMWATYLPSGDMAENPALPLLVRPVNFIGAEGANNRLMYFWIPKPRTASARTMTPKATRSPVLWRLISLAIYSALDPGCDPSTVAGAAPESVERRPLVAVPLINAGWAEYSSSASSSISRRKFFTSSPRSLIVW